MCIRNVSADPERVRSIAAILPSHGDPERLLHEAAVIEEMLDGHPGWNDEMLGAIRADLDRFGLCTASACAPYVRRRLASPFAGDENRPGTLRDRVKLFSLTLRNYERAHGIPRASYVRVRLLTAAFLLLLEGSASISREAA